MGVTESPHGGWECTCWGGGDPGRGCPQEHTYLIDLLDPPVNAVEGPAVGDVIHQKDPLQGKRGHYEAQGPPGWKGSGSGLALHRSLPAQAGPGTLGHQPDSCQVDHTVYSTGGIVGNVL